MMVTGLLGIMRLDGPVVAKWCHSWWTRGRMTQGANTRRRRQLGTEAEAERVAAQAEAARATAQVDVHNVKGEVEAVREAAKLRQRLQWPMSMPMQ